MRQARILIIEDEGIIARDLQKRLESLGYVVTSAAATGEEAIIRASSDSPDLVLMDIVLPGDVDGIEAAARIRESHDIPVVYVTAYADEQVLERAKLTEPFGYILKPFDDRELRSVIEMALFKSSVDRRLKQHNEFFRNIMESLSHPFYVIDAEDYTVVMANSAAGFGELSPGSKCYSLTHHVDAPCGGNDHPCMIEEIRRTGKPARQEHLHYDARGNARTFEIHGYPIRDKDGDVVQIIEYTQDVTERKKLENELRHSQKLESVGRLAGGVAHDFNNLLTAIMGYSEMALMLPPEVFAEDHPVRKHLCTISEAGQKAEALTRQLLAFSRKQTLEMKVVDINQLIGRLSRILKVAIGEDVLLEISADVTNPVVRADAGQIEQVLMNLAVNARDAMPCGGKLTIETREVELGEEYTGAHAGLAPGSYAMIAVTDTGEGMSREVQENIFEPFFTTKGSKGTGLGLSTTYGIVRQHNGHIFVYSEPGKGSTFKVYLPVAAESGTGLKAAEAPAQSLKGSETILVVDDDSTIRRMVLDTLSPLGYRLLEASCGEEALQRSVMENQAVDILLTDVIMPDMNGHDLAAAIVRQRPGTEVIYMSGYTDETIGRFGIAEGKSLFIQKPLTPRKLAMTMREVLDERRNRV